MVVLDTDVVIDHLRQSIKSTVLMKLAGKFPKEVLSISVITVQELFEGRSTRDVDKEKDLIATISPLKILPYTYEVAQTAGQIARDLASPIELADAAIAATAILHHSPLFTFNTKDFSLIPKLELLKI